MITVTIKSGRKELARIQIENMDGIVSEFADYSAQFAVDTGDGGLAMYQRRIDQFPRRRYNVLGLLRLALSALDEKDLTLDADPDARRSSNLERRLPRVVWPF